VTPHFAPRSALESLQRHGVRFVLIGGMAGRAWGSTTVTDDLDVCYDRTADNLERLAVALKELDARLRGVEDDVPFLLDAKTLERGQNFTFDTAAGALDVLALPAGTGGFDELMANATELDLGQDLVVPVCDLDDLIRMKRAAGRPKDRIELEVLVAVREEREALGLEGSE
jgi:hypothetical protein